MFTRSQTPVPGRVVGRLGEPDPGWGPPDMPPSPGLPLPGHVSPVVVTNQLRSKKSFGLIVFIAMAVSMSSWRISRISSQTTGASATCG